MKPSDEALSDFVQPFQFESNNLRGRLVRLGPSLDFILHQHAYPQAVGALLAEAVVIAAALGTSLKYEGVFTFQAKGDGPVRLLVVDITNKGGIRAYAQFNEERLAQSTANTPLLGKGYLAFTVDQNQNSDRYQGIVELQSGSLAEAVQHYFRQSEQLPTGIMAAVACDAYGRWQGGSLIIQQMPHDGGIIYDSTSNVDDDWYRAMMLMGTCTSQELTDPFLSAHDLLYRLFHEEGVRVYEPQAFQHQCRCSEKRVEDMLRSLPREEIEKLAINDVVEVTCEFCNRHYRFEKERRETLYREVTPPIQET